MKKLLLACCLGAAVVTAHAQPQHPGPDANQRLTYMQKSLQLTDEQTQKIKPILEQSAQQRHALKEKYEEQFKAFRTDMKNQDQQTRGQLASVLTPAQMQAFDAQREAHKHFLHRGPGHRSGGHGPHDEARSDTPQP